MDKVRVAVIGAGALANQMHYPSLVSFDDVEVVACCDLLPDRLARTAERFGIAHTYQDAGAMLAEQQPDAVWIMVAPHHLYDLAATVLEAGVHLFVEKPPGITLAQTRNMAALAERHGCLTMCGFNRRFLPLLNACLDPVRARGPLEQISVTFYKHHFAGDYFRGAVDILTSDVIHAVDLVRWLGGEPRRVAASTRCTGGETYPTSWNALIEFESGAVGTLHTCWTVGKRFHSAEFHAKGISCYTDLEHEGTVWADGRNEPLASFRAAELVGSDEPHRCLGFWQEDRHFIDCVRSGTLPLSNLGDAVRTMELVEQIRRGA
jgi:predicted dehydrogenase